MVVGGGTQQNRSGVDGPGGQHHLVGHKQPVLTSHVGFHTAHLGARWVDMQPGHLRAGANRDGALGLERPINAKQLGVARGVHRRLRPAQGQVVGMGAVALQCGAKLLHEGLNRLGGQAIVRRAAGLGGINPRATMDAIEILGLGIPRGHLPIGQPPGRRMGFLQGKALKFLFAHAFQHPAPDLGVAAKGIQGLGGERITVRTTPLFFGVVTILAEQAHIGHVLILDGELDPPLEHKHLEPRCGQVAGQGAASSPRSHHNDVVGDVINDHRFAPGIVG